MNEPNMSVCRLFTFSLWQACRRTTATCMTGVGPEQQTWVRLQWRTYLININVIFYSVNILLDGKVSDSFLTMWTRRVKISAARSKETGTGSVVTFIVSLLPLTICISIPEYYLPGTQTSKKPERLNSGKKKTHINKTYSRCIICSTSNQQGWL